MSEQMNGMKFMLSFGQFVVTGVVGEEKVKLDVIDAELAGYEGFADVIDKLQRLRDEVAALNRYAGDWEVHFPPEIMRMIREGVGEGGAGTAGEVDDGVHM